MPMPYDHRSIEKKWREVWRARESHRVAADPTKEKFYVLDMFPYPSGAGLHVGHPLGYIASDIVARYKRHCGFNVLHPMGYDSFGLPAEQYAIQTGQHPARTTEANIKRYRGQLDAIGFSFDWDREVRTSDPSFYKWTQWIFLQLFDSWYDRRTDQAAPIGTLLACFEQNGFCDQGRRALTGDEESEAPSFTAAEWRAFNEREKEAILQHFRLAYRSEAWVNWCPALGTVLANDEVKDGVSERGGHPVERKRMPQWSLRITAYAQRLLDGLAHLDWSESIKEAQRNWIGRSDGALVRFPVVGSDEVVEVFTTRPDTLFGVTFVTLAPEHTLLDRIVTAAHRVTVDAYIAEAKDRSERERMADVGRVSGVFTGAYVRHPFTGEEVPVWVGDYVLAGYGTGAVMAVPGGDQRDWNFATHFGLPIIAVTEGADIAKGADESREAIICSDGFLKGLRVPEAIARATGELVRLAAGERRVNYRLRDAAFGRQRYWGEPIPIYYKEGIPHPLPESELPLKLPEVDKFLPTEEGEPPLARATNWTYQGHPLETTTMPGWAGSSWYFLRYMDPRNKDRFASEDAIKYWRQVDLYVGGSEHATGHLLYFRFWTKFLFDRGWIPFDEPAKKLVNQGMIQGRSALSYKVNYRIKVTRLQNGIGIKTIETFASSDLVHSILSGSPEDSNSARNTLVKGLGPLYDVIRALNTGPNTVLEFDLEIPENASDLFRATLIPVDTLVDEQEVDVQRLLQWAKAGVLIFNNEGKVLVDREVDKMSKSKHNVVNPDDIIEKYGADTLRLYEMFLGPIEASKPWDTNGIEGTFRFLKKLWNLFHDEKDNFSLSEEAPTPAEMKVLHGTIKKVTEDIDRMSFNTSVSQFMIAVNELGELKCRKRAVLEPLTILLAPFAPHIAEEVWEQLGHNTSITTAVWPEWEPQYLVEDSFCYPISFNGRTRLQLEFPIALSREEVEAQVLANPEVRKRLEGRAPKKVIVVPKRIVNIVV